MGRVPRLWRALVYQPLASDPNELGELGEFGSAFWKSGGGTAHGFQRVRRRNLISLRPTTRRRKKVLLSAGVENHRKCFFILCELNQHIPHLRQLAFGFSSSQNLSHVYRISSYQCNRCTHDDTPLTAQGGQDFVIAYHMLLYLALATMLLERGLRCAYTACRYRIACRTCLGRRCLHRSLLAQRACSLRFTSTCDRDMVSALTVYCAATPEKKYIPPAPATHTAPPLVVESVQWSGTFNLPLQGALRRGLWWKTSFP